MTTNVPAHINPATASLPATYESAKKALAECSKIDECHDWSNKAAALASYAKQADDDTLHRYALRISARAIRRCGELLKQFDGRGEHRRTEGNHSSSNTQKQAAQDAGMSEHQQHPFICHPGLPAIVQGDNLSRFRFRYKPSGALHENPW